LSFIGSFTKDIKRAKGAADDALKTGLDTGTSQYEAAKDYYVPYTETGGKANAMLADALGLNGRPAYQDVVDNFMGDPFRQSNEDFANKQLANQYNARGGLYSGNAMLAAARGSLERGSVDWNKWLDRLTGQQSGGFQASNAMAGLTQGQGDMAYGYGQTKAGNEINYGNAMAATRNIGINNLLGVAGTAVRGFTPGWGGATAFGNMVNAGKTAYNAMAG
jgi:hypothetical protein